QPGRPPSGVRSADYTLQVADPVLDPPPSAFDRPVQVTVSVATADATLHWSTSGDATETDPEVASGGRIAITPPLDLSVLAAREGWDPSRTAGAYRAGVVTPTLTPPGGSFAKPIVVRVTTTTAGATLRYTTDGTEPSLSSPAIRSGARLRVERSLTIKVAPRTV